MLQIPTAFSIAPHEVSRFIEAGRSILRQSPEFQALLTSLTPPSLPS